MGAGDNSAGLAQTGAPDDAAVATAPAQAHRGKRTDHAAMIASQSLELQRLAPREIARFVLGEDLLFRREADAGLCIAAWSDVPPAVEDFGSSIRGVSSRKALRRR
jgi:hypothetical protein